MDDPNITMEYIRLEEEKGRRRGKVYNWETATYVLLCEPTVSSLNDNKIDFTISFEESDDEDYAVSEFRVWWESWAKVNSVLNFDYRDERFCRIFTFGP
nr:hypothetical protein [Tanacetum cinerariifolium]